MSQIEYYRIYGFLTLECDGDEDPRILQAIEDVPTRLEMEDVFQAYRRER